MREPRISPSTFVDQVRQSGDLASNAVARAVTKATLETLGEQLARGEAEDLGEFITPDFLAWLLESERETAEKFDVEEFLDRVADRAGEPRSDAHDHAQAVLDALEMMVPDGELDRAWVQLPDEYDTLRP